MRLKIKLPNDKTYWEVTKLLKDRQAKIFVASDRRNLLSTSDLPDNLIKYIEEHGGIVVSEQMYDSDTSNHVFCGS